MIATQEQPTTDIEVGKFELINGEFSPEEAFKIINHLYFQKINFHELNNFSQLVRFGSEDPLTQKRISELKAALQQAREYIEEAQKSGRTLRLDSMISIEMI